jgi:hypothetical protein
MTVLGIIARSVTVALFFATAAFPTGDCSMRPSSALLSFGAFLIGLVAARVLKVGRFS